MEDTRKRTPTHTSPVAPWAAARVGRTADISAVSKAAKKAVDSAAMSVGRKADTTVEMSADRTAAMTGAATAGTRVV